MAILRRLSHAGSVPHLAMYWTRRTHRPTWLEIQYGRAALPKALVRDPELAPCGLWPVAERLWYHVFGPYLVETVDSCGLVSFGMHSPWLRDFLPTFCKSLDAA